MLSSGINYSIKRAKMYGEAYGMVWDFGFVSQ